LGEGSGKEPQSLPGKAGRVAGRVGDRHLMAENSTIEWTDHTANFWWGCMKVSEGCKNCYAETLSERYGKKIWGAAPREYKSGIWDEIFIWDKKAGEDGVRRKVFVSSMSDFLEAHPQVSDWRNRAKTVILNLKNLDILLLTKRPENAGVFLSDWYENWPSHVWMGVSIENQKMADERIPELLSIPAKVLFLSVEPMLERIDLTDYREGSAGGPYWVDWVICGGESGAGCRPMEIDWARKIYLQCKSSQIPFFMKQLGGHPNKRHQLADFPEDLRAREFPR